MQVLINVPLDKSRCAAAVKKFFWHAKIKSASYFLQELMNLGFDYGSRLGISLNLEDFKGFNYVLPLTKTRQSHIRYLLPGGLEGYSSGPGMRSSSGGLSTNRACSSFNFFMRSFSPLIPVPNPLYLLASTGARGNWSQVRQLVGFRGFVSNSQGQLCSLPITEGLGYGLRVHEYFLSCYGARKGIIDTALRTAESGHLTRKMVEATQKLTIRERQCTSPVPIEQPVGINVSVTGQLQVYDALSIEGRYTSEDLCLPRTQAVVVSKGEVINTHALQFLIQEKIHRLKFLSPFSCDGLVCQRCYGLDRSSGQKIRLGESVGTLAGQAVGEPGTQLVLRTFHTGGVFESYGSSNDLFTPQKHKTQASVSSHLFRTENTLHRMMCFVQVSPNRVRGVRQKTRLSHLNCLHTLDRVAIGRQTGLPTRHSLAATSYVGLKDLNSKLMLSTEKALLSILYQPGLSSHFIEHTSLHTSAWDCASPPLRSFIRHGDWKKWANIESAFSTSSGEIKVPEMHFTLAHRKQTGWQPLLINPSLGQTKTSLVSSLPGSFGLCLKSHVSGFGRPSYLAFQKLVSLESFEKGLRAAAAINAMPQVSNVKSYRMFVIDFFTGLLSVKGEWAALDSDHHRTQYLHSDPGLGCLLFSGPAASQNKIKWFLSFLNSRPRFNSMFSFEAFRNLMAIRSADQNDVNWTWKTKDASSVFTFSGRMVFGHRGYLSIPESSHLNKAAKINSVRAQLWNPVLAGHEFNQWLGCMFSMSSVQDDACSKLNVDYFFLPNSRAKVQANSGAIEHGDELASNLWHTYSHFYTDRAVIARGCHVMTRLTSYDKNFVRLNERTSSLFLKDAQSVVGVLPSQLLLLGRLKKLKCQSYKSFKLLSAAVSNHYKSSFLLSGVTREVRKVTGFLLDRASSVFRWPGEPVTTLSSLCYKEPRKVGRAPRMRGHVNFLIDLQKKKLLYGSNSPCPDWLPWAQTLQMFQYMTKQSLGSARDIILGIQTIEGILEIREPGDNMCLADTSGLIGSYWHGHDETVLSRQSQALQSVEHVKARSCGQTYLLSAPAPRFLSVGWQPRTLYISNQAARRSKVFTLCYGGQPVHTGVVSTNAFIRRIYDHHFVFHGVFIASKLALLVAQQLVSRSLFEQYRFQGISLPTVHFELIARRMASCVRVWAPGQLHCNVGDILPLGLAHIMNMAAINHGYQHCFYKPLVLGISKCILLNTGFLSASSFQETVRVLAQTSVRSSADWCTDLKARVILGQLIPVGTGSRVSPETSVRREGWKSSFHFKDVFSQFRVFNKKQGVFGAQ